MSQNTFFLISKEAIEWSWTMNSETDVAKQCYHIWKKAAIKCYQIWQKSTKSAKITRFGKKRRKLSKTGKWPKVVNTDSHTSVTNCPGIKKGQSNCQKMPKNAKKSQNVFPLLSTVRKLLSEVEPWSVKLMWPNSATRLGKKLPKWQKIAKLAKIHQGGKKSSN